MSGEAPAGPRSERNDGPQGEPRRLGLLAAAERWRSVDPDPVTVAALDEVVRRADLEELEELFGAGLTFGTAGIRGALGPGPNRMNRLVVRRVVGGLAAVLRASFPDAAARGVVVGRDARHGSAEFAAEAVSVLRGAGLTVHLFDEPVPTPLAVGAVRDLRAVAGLVVTASHNPRTDNGLKVVWDDGAQIIAPWDQRIAAAAEIAEMSSPLGPDGLEPAGQVTHLGGASGSHPVVLAYLARARSLTAASGGERQEQRAELRVAVTAMHGVGGELLTRVLAESGYRRVHPVESQQRPDPDFPTVTSPNPEDPAALAALLDLASTVGADIALALDPDADRLAVAVPHTGDRAPRNGSWRVLTGDEVGALLLQHLLERTERIEGRLAATTIVSSRLAARICAARGVQFHETLTGFKWLCRPGIEHPDLHQVLLYEEAMGYAVGAEARDKDGITAALVLLDLACELRARGATPADALDDLALQHGAHVQVNGSIPLAEGRPDGVGAALRAAEAAVALGGLAVQRADRPDADVVRLMLSDDTRVVVRPSGTEPKLKYYCEAVEPVTPRPGGTRAVVQSARDVARARAERAVADLRSHLER